MHKHRNWLIGVALLILALGGALRMGGLPRPPAGPYYDEAANGILAASIANEGYRPIFISSYTGKEVLFFYVAALMVKVLGPGLLALRLTSALLGALTIAATLWCVYELYAAGEGGKEPGTLALLTGGLLATSFWHLALSRIGLRAVAQPLFQALTLALLWRGLRSSRWWELVAAGLCCGLAGYTYLAARLFPIPLALALVALLIADRGCWRRRLAQIMAFVGTAAAVWAPLGIYFLRNPERFAVRIEQVAGQGPRLTLAQGFGRALGMFFLAGDPLPRLNLPGKPVFGPLLAAAFLFGLGLVLHRLVTGGDPLARAREVLLVAWIPIMILPTALTVADIVPHSLRAAGLLPLIYLFPALAIAWLLERIPRWGDWKLWAALGTVLVTTGATTARDYFLDLAGRTDHYEVSDGDLADMAEWLNAAGSMDPSSEGTVYVASIHYRHPTLALLADDYAAFKWLTGGRTLVIPAQDSALLTIPRSIDYGWADPYLPSGADLNARHPGPERGDWFCVHPEIPAGPDGAPAFDAYCLEAGTPLTVSHEVRVDFSHVIQLEGYDFLGVPGVERNVDVVLRWQVLNPAPSGDFHVFAHLLDAWGSQWGESLPFHYPSAQWAPGESFLDRIVVQLPSGTPPGAYQLQVGLYSPEGDSNLTAVGSDGGFAGTIASLPVSLSPSAKLKPLEGIRRPLGVELAPGLTLLGANLDTASARTREPIFLTLFWQAEAPLDDITVRLRLGDRVLYEGAPVHGTYPTSAWRVGEGVADRYNPRVPLDMAEGEWALTVEVGAAGGGTGSAELGQVKVVAPERSYALPEMAHTLEAELGEAVALLGYDVTGLDGPVVGLTLYWRSTREIDTDYTVFVHVLAADGRLVGQADSMPQGGTYPTSLWAAGEVIADPYQIPVAPGAPLPWSFRVGMYLPTTGEGLGEAVLAPGSP
jgi:hypothetical protein